MDRNQAIRDYLATEAWRFHCKDSIVDGPCQRRWCLTCFRWRMGGAALNRLLRITGWQL